MFSLLLFEYLFVVKKNSKKFWWQVLHSFALPPLPPCALQCPLYILGKITIDKNGIFCLTPKQHWRKKCCRIKYNNFVSENFAFSLSITLNYQFESPHLFFKLSRVLSLKKIILLLSMFKLKRYFWEVNLALYLPIINF